MPDEEVQSSLLGLRYRYVCRSCGYGRENLYSGSRIKAQKIWKDGKVKEYQTDLTDVVREYIGRRFDVHSTEKTSDETLQAMKPLIEKDLFDRLKNMLQLADLVKFAKWHTTPEENEQGLKTAYDFVLETKVSDEADGSDGSENNEEEDEV